jgi:hypothetical protein
MRHPLLPCCFAVCALVGLTFTTTAVVAQAAPRAEYPGLVVKVFYRRMSGHLDNFVGMLIDLNQTYPMLIQPETYWVVDKSGLPPTEGTAMGFPNLGRIKTQLDRSGKRAAKAGVTELPAAVLVLNGDSMAFNLNDAPEKVQAVLNYLIEKNRSRRQQP